MTTVIAVAPSVRPTLTTRRSVLAALLAAVVLVGLPAPVSAADAGAEAQFVAAINASRSSAGLPGLAVRDDLTAVARRHSARMADSGNLHHNPNLANDVSGWRKVGENVGVGPSAGSIHDAFMGSPSHRANILSPDFTEVGVGVEVRDGRIWVTEVFRLPAATAAPAPQPPPAPAAPAPAPAPPTAAAPAAPPVDAPPPPPAPPPSPQPTLERTAVVVAQIRAQETGERVSDLLATLLPSD